MGLGSGFSEDWAASSGCEDPELGEVGFGDAALGFATFVFLKPEQFHPAGADFLTAGGVAKGFEGAGGLEDAPEETEIIGGRLSWIEENIDKFGFAENLQVAGDLADRSENVFEILFGELVKGVLRHGQKSRVSLGQ